MESATERIVEGESDMVSFRLYNTPDVGLRTEQVGADPHITYEVNWKESGTPGIAAFERVSHVEVKLLTMLSDMPEGVREAGEEAHNALVNLKCAMADARGLTDEQRQEVNLGNFEALPEVTGKETR